MLHVMVLDSRAKAAGGVSAAGRFDDWGWEAATRSRNRGGPGAPGSTGLDDRLQALCCQVPLCGNLVEVLFRLLQALAVELPDLLAPAAGMAHQTRVTEGVEVPRNRLARHPSALAET